MMCVCVCVWVCGCCVGAVEPVSVLCESVGFVSVLCGSGVVFTCCVGCCIRARVLCWCCGVYVLLTLCWCCISCII